MTQLSQQLYLIAQHSPWLAGYCIVVVQNFAAGGYRSAKCYEKNLQIGWHYITSKVVLTTPKQTIDWTVLTVEQEGDFTKMLAEIKDKLVCKKQLFITLGGDGIASEVATSVALQGQEFNQQSTFLFAPMGTGNDGTSCKQMDDFFMLLHQGPVGGKLVAGRLISIVGQQLAPRYAYNVASLGLDAFVADATNTLKKIIPGNFYKVMVDVAAVLYQSVYRIKRSHITYLDDLTGKNVHFAKKLLLLCIGYQGGATYGGGKCVIPGPENVLALEVMPLWKMVFNKDKISKGQHRQLKESNLFTSSHLTYHYNGKILLNTDGEITKLTGENFPLAIDIKASGAFILKKA